SSLSTFWLNRTSTVFRGDYIALNRQYIENIPLPRLQLGELAGKSAHDRIVKLVDSMLGLHKQLAAAKSAPQRAIIQRQIDATDAEIDRLVYELYGLTEEEIAVVEEAGKR